MWARYGFASGGGPSDPVALPLPVLQPNLSDWSPRPVVPQYVERQSSGCAESPNALEVDNLPNFKADCDSLRRFSCYRCILSSMNKNNMCAEYQDSVWKNPHCVECHKSHRPCVAVPGDQSASSLRTKKPGGIPCFGHQGGR